MYDDKYSDPAYQRAIGKNIRRNAFVGYCRKFGDDAKIVLDMINSKDGVSDFWTSLANSVREYGKPTDKQHLAVLRIIAENEARKASRLAEEAASSNHVGMVGQRHEFAVTCSFETYYSGEYGRTYIYGFKDGSGNVIIAKLTKSIDVARGDAVQFSAYVKTHGEREGVKQTIVNRIKGLTKALASAA